MSALLADASVYSWFLSWAFFNSAFSLSTSSYTQKTHQYIKAISRVFLMPLTRIVWICCS